MSEVDHNIVLGSDPWTPMVSSTPFFKIRAKTSTSTAHVPFNFAIGNDYG